MWTRVGHSAVSLKVEGIHLRHYDLSQKKQAQELKIKTTSKNKQLSSIFFLDLRDQKREIHWEEKEAELEG